jgi:hypothetical protein
VQDGDDDWEYDDAEEPSLPMAPGDDDEEAPAARRTSNMMLGKPAGKELLRPLLVLLESWKGGSW